MLHQRRQAGLDQEGGVWDGSEGLLQCSQHGCTTGRVDGGLCNGCQEQVQHSRCIVWHLLPQGQLQDQGEEAHRGRDQLAAHTGCRSLLLAILPQRQALRQATRCDPHQDPWQTHSTGDGMGGSRETVGHQSGCPESGEVHCLPLAGEHQSVQHAQGLHRHTPLAGHVRTGPWGTQEGVKRQHQRRNDRVCLQHTGITQRLHHQAQEEIEDFTWGVTLQGGSGWELALGVRGGAGLLCQVAPPTLPQCGCVQQHMPAVPVVAPHTVHCVQREEGTPGGELGGELQGQAYEGIVTHRSQPVVGEEAQVVLHQLGALLLLQGVPVVGDLDVQLQGRHNTGQRWPRRQCGGPSLTHLRPRPKHCQALQGSNSFSKLHVP